MIAGALSVIAKPWRINAFSSALIIFLAPYMVVHEQVEFTKQCWRTIAVSDAEIASCTIAAEFCDKTHRKIGFFIGALQRSEVSPYSGDRSFWLYAHPDSEPSRFMLDCPNRLALATRESAYHVIGQRRSVDDLQ